MPRDLQLDKPDPSVPLTESPNSVITERSESPGQNSSEEESPGIDRGRQFVIIPEDQYVETRTTRLHPYTRPLTISDLDSVEALENAAFDDPRERASREKVRLLATAQIIAFRRVHVT